MHARNEPLQDFCPSEATLSAPTRKLGAARSQPRRNAKNGPLRPVQQGTGPRVARSRHGSLITRRNKDEDHRSDPKDDTEAEQHPCKQPLRWWCRASADSGVQPTRTAFGLIELQE